MKDSPFRSKLPEVKGDFDALLTRDKSQSPPPRQLPPIALLRNSSSFKGSVDSTGSFATAVSADLGDRSTAAEGASSRCAEGRSDDGSAPEASTSVQEHTNGSAPSGAADSNGGVVGQEDEGVSFTLHSPQQNGTSMHGGGHPLQADNAIYGQAAARQQPAPVAHAAELADLAENEPALDIGGDGASLHENGACRHVEGHEGEAAGSAAAMPVRADTPAADRGSIQQYSDPLRSTASLSDVAAAEHLDQRDQQPEDAHAAAAEHELAGLTLHSADMQHRTHVPEQEAAAAPDAGKGSGAMGEGLTVGKAFLRPDQALQRGPGPSAEELPVSTLRMGRCFSGYVSAEEDAPGSCPEAEDPSQQADQNQDPAGAVGHLQQGVAEPAEERCMPASAASSAGPEPDGEELRDFSFRAQLDGGRAVQDGAAEDAQSGSEPASGFELQSLEGGSPKSDPPQEQELQNRGDSGSARSAAGMEVSSTSSAAVNDGLSAASTSEAGFSAGAGQAAALSGGGVEEGVSIARVDSLGRAASHAAAEVGANEDSADWRAQRKHFFVLTNAGTCGRRPVFTAHGSEHALAGFMAIIDAVMSFAKDRGDALRSLRAGEHLIVFLERGPLYLVAVSSLGEPEAALALQLDLLHAHFLAILTNSFDRTLARNPRFEPRRLLGGTEDVLRRFLASFGSSPAGMLAAFEPLRLPPSIRHTALVALQAAVKRGGAVYGVLLAGDRIVALSQPRAQPLHAHDALLLASFLTGADSFRAATECFSPICLPRHNPSAFLHAYVHYLDSECGLCLAMLAARQDAFFGLSEAASVLQQELQLSGTSQAIAGVLGGRGAGRLRLPDAPRAAGGGPPGTTPLQHFLYKAPARGQFVMPAFSSPLTEVMPAYARAHAAMFGDAGAAGPPRQRAHFAQDGARTLLAYTGAEYEVYALFDALMDRAAASGICQRLCAWIKAQHADLFVPLSF